MKIIEIIPQLGSGGAERFTVDLCNELVHQHEVILIVLHPLGKYDFYVRELSPNVKVMTMNKKNGIDILLPIRLLHVIMRFKPDVIHTHLRGIMYTFLTTLLKQKNIVHCHTIHNAADKEAGSYIGYIVRRFLFKHHFSTPITISEESQRSFVEHYNMDSPMIFNGRNIPNKLGMSHCVLKEINTYRYTSQTRIIVNLARMMKQKRQGLIARVCRRLYDDGYDFTMLLIGRYDETSTIYKEVIEAACPVVHLLGERQNPLEYLKMADAYCLMSGYEGMPISLIEAMGTGTVPVCTPVGGIVDVIKDGKNGILSKDISEAECYIALKRFLELSDAELYTMKEKTLASYAPFSMTECADIYINLFEEKINNQQK